MSDETPEADAAEQRTEVRTHDDELPTHLDTGTADEGDLVEQAREVPLDEEDDEALQDELRPTRTGTGRTGPERARPGRLICPGSGEAGAFSRRKCALRHRVPGLPESTMANAAHRAHRTNSWEAA